MTNYSQVTDADLDLEALDPNDIHPAAFYALCREAERRGIPVSLDDPESPPTVAGVIASVAADREKHGLRDALRAELTKAFGSGFAATEGFDRIEEVTEDTPYESWVGCHVALAYEVSDHGDAESGPRVSFDPTQWVNVMVEGDQRYALMFVVADPPFSAVEVTGSPSDVARTLVGILRAAGYEDIS